jgi:type II secretory pathway component PulF
MPLYSYMAIDPKGQNVSGSLPAQDRSSALDQLTRKGLVPVQVDEQAAAAPKAAARADNTNGGGRVSQAAAEAFTRELSNLLAGGVALSRALHILAQESSQPASRRQRQAIHDDVVGGMPLAEAMSKYPRSFPPVQVAMVRAGETGGFLDVVLAQIAEFRSRERDLKSKVKGAMIYPMVLAVVAAGVLVFLMTYFIPKFSLIFAQFKAALPPLTRVIVAVSGFVTHYGLVILVAVAILIALVRQAMKSPAGHRTMERVLLRVPALGAVVARFALVRFCRMLGTLLGAGVPMVAALKVAREAIGNQTLTDAVATAIEEVQRGSPLAKSLSACPQLFPPSVTEIIAVAEESGRVDQELVRLALTNEAELDRRLRMLVALAEPAMLFLMAAFVGTVVIGMLLPVFSLQQFIH